MNLLAANDLGSHGEVAVAGIGRRANVGLVDRLTGGLAYRHDVAGTGRHGDQWLQSRQVDLLVHVVIGVSIRVDFAPVLVAPL